MALILAYAELAIINSSCLLYNRTPLYSKMFLSIPAGIMGEEKYTENPIERNRSIWVKNIKETINSENKYIF